LTASANGTLAADLTPWAGLFPMDAATPITAVHLGIEYRGEVVRAARWSAGLGQAPGSGVHFKIILLQDRPKLDLPKIADRNIAICVPASSPGRHAHRIIGEITAAKQAAYLTRRDVDAAAINSALRERQDDLENQLVTEESARYSNGDICVQDGPGPEIAAIYRGSDPMAWMENLAGWLLARCYPSLPINTHTLAQPVCEDDISELFASIFGQPGAGDGPLRSYGPALGLSSQESSGSYDPSDCPVFPLVQEKLGGGTADFGELHHHLAHEVGLTGWLASLYLTLFVHNERPEHQIQLVGGCALSMADGGPLLGARVTPDLIPLIAWDGDLASNAVSIGMASEPRFNDVRHHMSALEPEIASCRGEMAGDALAAAIKSLGDKTSAARLVLDFLAAGPNAPSETEDLIAALDRLSQISGDDHAGIYHSIRAAYPSLLDLGDDLETMHQLAALDNDSVEISGARSYIASADVPAADYPNLAVDRETLLTGLSPSRLTRSRGRGWNAIARDAAAFKVRYSQAYREHHRRYHDALPEFQATLTTAKKRSAALGLLNTIAELGTPEGAGLANDVAALTMGPVPCSQSGSELDLATEPICPECQITLAQNVPSAELARLAPRVDMALGGKTRELSRRLVEKALAGRTDERWLEFLQIVQASELSSLANTLDNDLVAFIKQVLD